MNHHARCSLLECDRRSSTGKSVRRTGQSCRATVSRSSAGSKGDAADSNRIEGTFTSDSSAIRAAGSNRRSTQPGRTQTQSENRPHGSVCHRSGPVQTKQVFRRSSSLRHSQISRVCGSRQINWQASLLPSGPGVRSQSRSTDQEETSNGRRCQGTTECRSRDFSQRV